MADESFQEKTEAPTPKRRQDALKKGEVPRSQEVTTAFLLLAGAGAVTMAGTGMSGALTDVFRMITGTLTALPTDPEGNAALVRAVAVRAFRGLAPLLLLLSASLLHFVTPSHPSLRVHR